MLEVGNKIKRPKASAVAVISDLEIFLPLAGIIDVQKEAARLEVKLKELKNILKVS